MQVPPPMVASNWRVQKLRLPPSCVKVQHLGAPVSVQSAGCAHRRTTCVPVQDAPRDVVQSAAAAHATESAPVVQLGMLPPVTGM
jgi:hypothetical protein